MLLTEEQIKIGYFNYGLSHNNNLDPHYNTVITEVSEWNGNEYVCIGCTQLYPPGCPGNPKKGYTVPEQKHVLSEWVEFMRTNTKAFRGVHFCTSLPQALLEAVCCQENLETLRIKWGTFTDWSCLENLKNLKYFTSNGFRAKVSDVRPFGKLKELVVLDLVDYKKIRDLTPLENLPNLEELVFAGFSCAIKDLEFLCHLPKLKALGLSAKLVKAYTLQELDALMLPDFLDRYDFFAKLKRNIVRL